MERKTCLITGASGDIGETVVQQVIRDGWQVILHVNQNIARVEKLIQKLPKESVLNVIQADLSTKGGIDDLLKSIHFHVDAYIHASGKALHELMQYSSDQEMEEMINLHVLSPWKISKSILPNMIKNKRGQIILISSIWGEVGASHEVIYSSVKGAQNSFVKALAKEVASSSINVNAVSPGLINTQMNHHFNSEELSDLIEDIPAGRLGTTEDVADVVCFLLSDKAKYINGQIISVNGAWF